MNLCVRVSSSVDFTPSRVATSACTRGSSCSSKAINSSSLLAKANVSLPVVGLIFTGGVTPAMFSIKANFGLDIRSLRSLPNLSSKSAFCCTTVVRCCSRCARSSSRIGSVNIRRVRSISFSSSVGNPLVVIL